MFRRFLPIFISLFFYGLSSNAQTTPATGVLRVQVDGIKTTEGKLVIKIFRKRDDLFGKPFLERTRTIDGPTVLAEFSNLPFASYAIMAYQDLNGNGVLDHNWAHIPAEPLGWSHHWHFGPFTGLPTFEKTKFAFTENMPLLTISLRP